MDSNDYLPFEEGLPKSQNSLSLETSHDASCCKNNYTEKKLSKRRQIKTGFCELDGNDYLPFEKGLTHPYWVTDQHSNPTTPDQRRKPFSGNKQSILYMDMKLLVSALRKANALTDLVTNWRISIGAVPTSIISFPKDVSNVYSNMDQNTHWWLSAYKIKTKKNKKKDFRLCSDKSFCKWKYVWKESEYDMKPLELQFLLAHDMRTPTIGVWRVKKKSISLRERKGGPVPRFFFFCWFLG